MPAPRTFHEVLTAAVNDFIENGYDSQERLEYWLAELQAAAMRSMVPEAKVQEYLTAELRKQYRAKVENGGILNLHPGVPRFTLQRVSPHLRAELDRRILASANLIKLNRREAIERTLQRFSGWATSIPGGGTDAAQRAKIKEQVVKPLASLLFVERRVVIDQGHKFVANLSEILARDTDALAGEWHSKWRQRNYNYREDHKERDGHVYAMPNNWALEKGLMKAGPDGYIDDVTRPGEEVFCGCRYRWIYNLNELPANMLTKYGAAVLAEAERQLA